VTPGDPERGRAEVDEFMQALDHPLKAEIEAVRAVVLGADEQMSERIKWNAPSFGRGGEDRVTMRLQPGDVLQLIFHRGAKVKDATGFAFDDTTGLLQWVAADRATVTLTDIEDVQAKSAAIGKVVGEWVRATS
jgi:hypothetical protein